jgi:PTS system nitrogen regulatory IIA component
VPLADILSADRILVANEDNGAVRDKREALERLSVLLSSGHQAADAAEILRVLSERERLQSTGVGGGVAVPHGSVERLDRQIAALLVCPTPIPFDAIDGTPVGILFALVGPKGAPAEHLKILARISRLLREVSFRQRLANVTSATEAYQLITTHDRGPA